jgi:photosystem II stability/assembly factor-like uncharacterized protein
MPSKTVSNNVPKGPVALLIGTRKGAWILRSDPSRRSWKQTGPIKLGNIVHHVVLDPRDRKTMLIAAQTGHLGPTVFRSSDFGKSWKEATTPPAFEKAPEGEKGRTVNHVFWLSPGHASEPGVWYAGTSPQGLFLTEDGGDTWSGVDGINKNPMLDTWTGGEQDGTPDGPKLHSIIVDPRNKQHMYVGMSGGGVFESTDEGATWAPMSRGLKMPFEIPNNPDPEYGFDPHCIMMHPMNPDLLYQQNHTGIFKLDRAAGRWEHIGGSMPKSVGDIGFPITLHPRNQDVAWVFPMDGTMVWPRTSPGGKPAVFMTKNAGRTWRRQAAGLPASQAWFTVKRQAMSADAHDPLGLYFGTTSGDVWASRNEGDKWTRICENLPHIYSIEAVELAR